MMPRHFALTSTNLPSQPLDTRCLPILTTPDAMELVAILLAFLQLCLACATYDDPFPRCSSCLSAVQHDAPGIGFGLTPNTGYVIHAESQALFNMHLADMA